MADKKKSVSKDDALEMAKNIGCSGVHEVDGSWMPCESAEELARISEAAGSNLEVPFSIPKGANEMKISSSGRKRRRLVDRKRWEKLTERSYGMVGTSAGIVSAPPAPPASPMGGIVSSGSGPGITGDMGGGGKGIMPFSPEVGDPDTFTSPDAARMRAAQVGCTGIRRYTTSSGRQVWMPCTTGVTFDRRTGQGAYRNERSRTEQQRIERIVRREVARSASFSGTKKSLRGSRTTRRNAGSVSINQDVTKSLIIAAREHNVMMRSVGMPQWSFASASELKSVMRRGIAAFDSLKRPDLGNRSKWGEMRVEAYLKMLSSGRPDNPKYVADNDLLKKEHPWRDSSETKALPKIPRNASSAIPLDGDGDGVVYDGETREMPAPTRAVGEIGRRAALMPLGGDNDEKKRVESDPANIIANYAKMKETVEQRFGEIKTEKQAHKALKKVFKKLVEFDFDIEETDGEIPATLRGVVIGLLHEGMNNKKYADGMLVLSSTGRMIHNNRIGGYIGLAGVMVRNGKLGGYIDINPTVGRGAAKNIPANPKATDGWCDAVVRDALKKGMPGSEIDEMYGAYISTHEWSHVLHFSKSFEDIGFKIGFDGVDKVGEMNGLSPRETSDAINEIEAKLVAEGMSTTEARLLARQLFMTDNYQAIDDLWASRPFDGLSDEEVATIDNSGFRSQVSPYANMNNFEMVAETRSAQNLGYPVPEADGWAKMSEWLDKKSERKKKNFTVMDNGDLFVSVCSGIRNPDEASTKALPRDADRDGWIDENEPLKRRFVGFATDVADAVRNAGSRVRGRKPKSRVRVVSSEGSTGRESRGIARGISARIEDTINELRDGEPEKNIFVPDITQDVPGSLSSSRLRGLLPSRKSHYKLVETQRNFPHAPAPAGEHKGASVEDLMQPNGKMTSTFEHFGLGSGMITPERQALHDSIIESIMFGNGKWSPRRSDKPMAWMMGGGPASGKTFLRQGGFFDTPQRGSEAVHLDADEIKHMLPEFDTLVKELQEKGMDPLQAAELVHSESTYIQKLAIKRAAEEGFHVVVDSTGDGGPKAFAERMKALKDNGYAIKGRIADVPIAMALAEAERRKLETGRGVPPTVVTDTHIDVARALLHGLQNGVYDDLEIVNNEDHSNPYTIAAYKDGVLVVHDQAAWKQILHKAGLGSVQKYEDVNYFAEEGKAKFIASKRVADRKIRTAKIEGFDSVIAEPAKALADALPGGVDYSKVKAVTEERRQELAAAYDKMEIVSKEAEQAYEDLRAETDRLYEALTKDMGINVEFVDNDPYRSHLEMIDDIEMNKTLKVKRTTPDEKHPLWDDEQSDRFRAIHDAFGHAATGRGFDRHGEEAAYQAHASLVEGELAKKALETELQAQNAAILTTGVVPPRKAGLIPEQPSTKADAGGKLSSMPQLITKPDVPATEDNQTPIPLTADDDNFYSTTMCHHLSGGRTVAQSDVVVPTDKLYDRLGDEPALSPETRQMIYRAAISGVSIEDSDVDETNKDIVAYYKLMQKSLKKMGKGVVADIPVSGVESVPYPMVKK